MIDLHMHTSRCGHASGTPEEYLEAAAAAGVSVMCFTDHLPLPTGTPRALEYAMPSEQLAQYVGDIRGLAVRSARAGGPEVLLGIEADWIEGRDDEIRRVCDESGFDMVLGSVHFVDGWAFDDPDLTDRYAEWDITELWDRYFATLSTAAGSGLFDVMAHPDLVKKFGHLPDVDPTPWYERTAEVFAATGVALEVNTAGLRKPCAELYPAPGFLRAAQRRGIPVTCGSDAHRPGEVGAGMDAARDALLEAGYRSVVVFRGRVPEEVPL
jgi:histidinol-phosphatase (PHP family)